LKVLSCGNIIMDRLNVRAILVGSLVNGPGSRVVIWTQGCTKGCKGCFNPETWKNDPQTLLEPNALAAQVLSLRPDGITLTGGDPLEQPVPLLRFLNALHDDGKLIGLPKGVILFTGYTWEEIQELPGVDGAAARDCVKLCDVVIDGRYSEELAIGDRLAGSSNQRFHFNPVSGRGRDLVSEADVFTDQAVEVHGETADTIQVTGFPDVTIAARKRLRELGVYPTA
jgi:anaerobic ribonucleoside-triphosphate reductase activating protein